MTANSICVGFGLKFLLLLRLHRLNPIGLHLREWLVRLLACNDLTTKTVGSWVIHLGGPRILTAVEEALPLSVENMAPSRGVLRDYGNMSPTVLFITERLRRDGAKLPLVILGFGPGLIVKTALVR